MSAPPHDDAPGAPARAYRLRLDLQADDLLEMATALMILAAAVERGDARGAFVSGGSHSGYVAALTHNPAQTHANYMAGLHAYLVARKSSP